MTAVVVVEAVAIALLGLLVAGLLRSHAEILRRLHDLDGGGEQPATAGTQTRVDIVPNPQAEAAQVGNPAADIAGTTPDGDAAVVAVSDRPHDTLIAFLSTGCRTCAGFWSTLEGGDPPGVPQGTRVVVVTKGPDQESEAEVLALAPADIPTVLSTEAWLSYGVPGSPYFVHVDGPSGRVRGEGTASTWDQVVNLLGQAEADRELTARRTATKKWSADAAREARADRELLAAGITPGHPSLYAGGTAPNPADPKDER